MKILNINSTVYCVHRRYIRDKITGGKVLVCKVRGYENISGTVRIVLKPSGYKDTITSATHRIFYKLEDAIISITTKKKR